MLTIKSPHDMQKTFDIDLFTISPTQTFLQHFSKEPLRFKHFLTPSGITRNPAFFNHPTITYQLLNISEHVEPFKCHNGNGVINSVHHSSYSYLYAEKFHCFRNYFEPFYFKTLVFAFFLHFSTYCCEFWHAFIPLEKGNLIV